MVQQNSFILAFARWTLEFSYTIALLDLATSTRQLKRVVFTVLIILKAKDKNLAQHKRRNNTLFSQLRTSISLSSIG